MIALLSPAKTLDETPTDFTTATQPRLLDQSEKLVKTLRKKSAGDLQELMGISEKLARLNHQRYQVFSTPFTPENAKPALLTFKGDVYIDLAAETFDEADLAFAQGHLRLLSGLYGVLRPLDLMQPYRLEMGTRLRNGRKQNLYEFWDGRITRLLNEDLAASGEDTILNLASQEYFSSVRPKQLKGRLLNIHFKEARDGKLKVISFNAKKARGRMAHLIIKERINEPTALRELAVNDYVFRPELSTENDWVWVKEA
ncbi:MAG: peroxide stress protein YaaA [Lewinella sp.]|nr:peroxide stress protein YaaA [Lewinella sp.]